MRLGGVWRAASPRRRVRAASLGRRLTAHLVDTAVGAATVGAVIAGRTLVVVRSTPPGAPRRRPSRAVLGVAVYGLWLLAHVVARAAFGTQSLGMAAAGVRLVTEDGRAASVGRWYVRGQGLRLCTWPIRRVLVRAPARWRAAEAIGTMVVEMAVVAARSDHRSIGDLIAGTLVVEAPRR